MGGVVVSGKIEQIEINRKRGDTKAIGITVSDDKGNVLDITGASFLLTVNSSAEPTDQTTQIFQITGSNAVGTDGKVSFPVSPANADNIGDFFCDIQMTESTGEISTIAEGTFKMTQDITK